MDSMRSLNRSLPRPPTSGQPPEQLLQAFKTAALSVTNLYKTAASDQARARTEGYQEALGDILQFLDKEDLGLRDGEGWQVRRWATERLDGRSPPVSAGNDSDDERREGRRQARSSSPILQRGEVMHVRQISTPPSPVRTMSTASQTSAPIQHFNGSTSRPEVFSFTSPHPYPQDIDMQPLETANISNSQSESHPPTPNSTSTPTVRVEVVPRGARTPHRSGNHSGRHGSRNGTSTRSLGSGAGTKRRIQFGDYFDIGNLGDGKDPFDRGGKRGRFG